MSEKQYHIARQMWVSHLKGTGELPDAEEEIFQDLIKRYSELHRSYHNISHVIDVIHETEHIAYPTNEVAVFASWFHDAVYDPRKTDNEKQSAMLAVAQLTKMGFTESFIERVANIIMLTKHDVVVKDNSDAHLVLDADLAILGKDENRFEEYERAIRKEYEWVPIQDYCKARIKILRSFLDRDPIYYLDSFRFRYERTARHNLQMAIKGLMQNVA